MAVTVRFLVGEEKEEMEFQLVDRGPKGLFLECLDEPGQVQDTEVVKNQDGILEIRGYTRISDSEEDIQEKLSELTKELVEQNYSGFEPEREFRSDFENEEKPGYSPDQIIIENKSFTIVVIKDLVDKKYIELNPDFQRNFIWDQKTQSRLIESIIMGLPLPPLFLSYYDDGRLTIVDGLQRINTIVKFLDDRLKLSKLEYLKELNGKKFSQLGEVLKPIRLRLFEQTAIPSYIIDYRSPPKLKYDLFRRINTGGKPLNSPEIRNCLSRKHLQNCLRAMVDLPVLRESIGINSEKDKRMEFRDVALRFIYFSRIFENHNISSIDERYSGDIEYELDMLVEALNRSKDSELSNYIHKYDIGLNTAYYLFGDTVFRKVLPSYFNNISKKPPINKTLMMALSVILSSISVSEIQSAVNRSELQIPFSDFIQSDPFFYAAITNGTNGKSNIIIAFKSIQKFLEQHGIVIT